MEQISHPMSFDAPIHVQYFYVLSICLLEFFIFHLVIRNFAGVVIGENIDLQRANHISMALVVSSFGKILLFVMVIWVLIQ
jgi:lipid intermediate transporter